MLQSGMLAIEPPPPLDRNTWNHKTMCQQMIITKTICV